MNFAAVGAWDTQHTGDDRRLDGDYRAHNGNLSARRCGESVAQRPIRRSVRSPHRERQIGHSSCSSHFCEDLQDSRLAISELQGFLTSSLPRAPWKLCVATATVWEKKLRRAHRLKKNRRTASWLRATAILIGINAGQSRLIISVNCVDHSRKIIGDLPGLSLLTEPCNPFVPQGISKTHERVLPRESSFRSSLDRYAFQLPRHS